MNVELHYEPAPRQQLHSVPTWPLTKRGNCNSASHGPSRSWWSLMHLT
jgi:hypothetical protein